MNVVADEAAFFDLDKTVIAKASMVAFGGTFYREGLINRRTIAKSLWGQVVYMHLGASEEKLARLRESVLKLTRGWDQEKVCEIVRATLEDVVHPFIYKEALDLIAEHREAGRKIVIISASPSEIVDPLAEHLGADVAISSRVKIGADGRYTGDMDFYAYGPHKAVAMQEMEARGEVDLARSFAYSDSMTDAPMLEVVGHPVVVNPDRALMRLANARNWEVRRFTHPVPFTERVPVTQPKPLAIAGGLAALGISAAVISRQLRRR